MTANTPFDESKHPRGGNLDNIGQFSKKQHSAPEPLHRLTPEVWNEMFGQQGDSHSLYGDARAAAGGDHRRVWVVIEGDYEAGPKVYHYKLGTEDIIVHAMDDAEAHGWATAMADEIAFQNPSVFAGDFTLERVYLDSNIGEVTAENIEQLETATNSWLLPAREDGRHANSVAYVVSRRPWNEQMHQVAVPW